MSRFDLELFVIFDEIYKTKSITRAAENLGIAQPTVSIALNKLRQHFGDVLFSRTSRGMEPTPHAQGLITEIREITRSVNRVLQNQQVFDPLASQREFKISMTDVSEISMLPSLLNHLREHAPGIRIDVAKISLQTPSQLSEGEVDLAIGYIPHLEAGFYQQKLFSQRFACLVAASHPRIGDRIGVDQYARESHIMVKNSGTGYSLVDKIMNSHGIHRKIVLRLPSFLGAARIVSQTEFIATVPERFGIAMASQERIRVVAAPIDLPSSDVKLHWHERFHSDPSNQWLRRMIASVCAA